MVFDMYVEIDKSIWKDGKYKVYTSVDKSDWKLIYKGNYSKAVIIKNAFVKIGFKFIKNR